MKKVSYRRSLYDIKGIHDARVYSIPKQQRSVHLDLYVLAREKERLEKELFQLQIKVNPLRRGLAQTNKRMAGLLQEIGRPQDVRSIKHGRSSAPVTKKMSIAY